MIAINNFITEGVLERDLVSLSTYGVLITEGFEYTLEGAEDTFSAEEVYNIEYIDTFILTPDALIDIVSLATYSVYTESLITNDIPAIAIDTTLANNAIELSAESNIIHDTYQNETITFITTNHVLNINGYNNDITINI